MFSGTTSSNRNYSSHTYGVMWPHKAGETRRVSSIAPNLETLVALQTWDDLQQLQELHVVEQRGFSQLPESSELLREVFPALAEVTLRDLTVQSQHLQRYM